MISSGTAVEAAVRWHPLTRVAFRFSFVYVGLFCLLFAQILFVFTGPVGRLLPDTAVIWQMVLLAPLFSWHLDGRLEQAGAQVDVDARTLTLIGPDAPLGSFTFAQSAPDRLALTGTLDGAPVSVTLQLEDPARFTLLNRGFHWVQEYPYFR